MKRWFSIIVLALMLALAACDATTKEARRMVKRAEGSSEELSAIDSLMWRQPDSALAQLQRFVVSPEADSLDEFNGHYCQLLISELLYKKDFKQSNREDLLNAVVYFDSLTTNTHSMSQQKRNVFLAARTHYINGVGYYEHGEVVPACAEYLKALEMMEGGFEEKELAKQKAQFVSYTYNRLGSLFSSQFMMDPAILCYKRAQIFCMIEQTSPYGISNNYYRIGIQYNKKGQNDTAMYYYEKAIECLTDSNCLVYRNIATNKSLLYYQISKDAELAIQNLKSITEQSANERERLTRYLTIGDVYYEAGILDSAKFYLEHVFEKKADEISRIQAAEYLRKIYDIMGESKKADACVRFLADHKKSEGETKAFVSKLEAMFKNYINQKQKKEAEEAREKAVRKAMNIIIPVAIGVVLVIIVLAKLGNKKLLKEQKEEADRMLGKTEQLLKEELRLKQAEAEKTLKDKEKHHQQEMEAKEAQARKEMEEKDKQHEEELEAERQTHRMQQAAMSGRLKRSNEELRELRDLKRQQTGNGVPKQETQVVSFNDEPICRLIMERVNEGQFKSKIDYIIYKDSALDKQQLLDLHLAVDRHFGQFTARLKKAYPELTNGDLDYCCLYLLGLTDADIAALMQRTYNTVFHRNGKMRKIFGSENPLPVTLMGMAKDSSFI